MRAYGYELWGAHRKYGESEGVRSCTNGGRVHLCMYTQTHMNQYVYSMHIHTFVYLHIYIDMFVYICMCM